MKDLTGRTLGRYRIVEQIGAGGMGEFCATRTRQVWNAYPQM